MRLFIAIQLNEEMKTALVGIQNEMRRRGVGGNYTSLENLHLTLAFIGEYPDPDGVLEAMETAGFTPFTLRLDGLGRFGDLWWAGLSDGGELSACARRLRHALGAAGIPFDRKKFTPHITLVRRAVWDERRGLPASSVPKAEMQVERISLMRSDRGRKGMIYTELGSIG
jgi:2'-5' RNA ligase